MSRCRLYRGPLNAGGYGRVPFGPPRFDAQGRRRGRQSVGLHRWVVEQVEGRPLEPGEVVLHLCDTPACFLYEHLRRGTQSENVQDAEAEGRGRRPHGEESPHAKLTAAEALAIYTSTDRQRELAARFGVSRALVRHIKAGRAWAHVTGARA